MLNARLLTVALVGLLALALALAGYGSAQATQSAAGSQTLGGSVALSPHRVAAKFAMWLANIGANEEEPATPAEVRADARAMHMTCSRPQFGQYACSFGTPQRNSSQRVVAVKQRCVAIVGSSGNIETGRCTDPGDKVSPLVTPGYVDCSTVGKVVTVTDPVGDQVVANAQHPLSPAARNHSDLTEIRVAATSKSFCVDFRTTTPFSLDSTLTLSVIGKGGPEDDFRPSIDQDRTPVPGLYMPLPTAIAGELGFNGDWSSLLIPAGDSPLPLPTGPFKFGASAEYNVSARTGGYSISDSTQTATYP